MKLFYRKYGAGKPLFIIHGLLGMSDNWNSLGKRFAEHFQVVLPDLRNHGQSPHADDFDYVTLSKDILGLMDEMGVQRAHIIGHSLGGRLALYLCSYFPERLEKTIIADIGPAQLLENPIIKELLDIIISTDLSPFTSLKDAELLLNKKVSSQSLKNLLMKNLGRTAKDEINWKLNAHGILKHLNTIGGQISFSSPYHGEILFIKGGLSDFIKSEDRHLIEEFLPKGQIIEIPGASHWIHADQPEAFYMACINFLL